MDPKKAISDLFGDNWPIRRRVMFLTLIWMGAQVTWMLVRGTDDALHQQAVMAFVGAIMSIICAYVFGAVWDDHNKRMRLRFDPQTTDAPAEETPAAPDSSDTPEKP